MAKTYEPIATTTLGSAQASYTFSSISSAYTDLILVTNVKAVSSSELRIQLNSDTGTNYSFTYLSGNGTSAFSSRGSNASRIPLNAYADASTTFAQTTISQIMNYSNATTYKTVITRASNANNGVDAVVGLWRNTAAITSINVFLGTGNLDTGSTFTLYGIKAA
jgi:hypothetical protein